MPSMRAPFCKAESWDSELRQWGVRTGVENSVVVCHAERHWLEAVLLCHGARGVGSLCRGLCGALVHDLVNVKHCLQTCAEVSECVGACASPSCRKHRLHPQHCTRQCDSRCLRIGKHWVRLRKQVQKKPTFGLAARGSKRGLTALMDGRKARVETS